MKPRSSEAGRLETDYLDRVRSELRGREPAEIDEILESLREHIEEEFSELTDDEVSLVRMADVLERLGSPDSYREEPEHTAPPPPPPAPTGRPVPGPAETEKEPIRISALTIINICATVVVAGVPVYMLPQFLKIFAGMGTELPVITVLVLRIPNLVHLALVPLGVLVLLGKDILIRNPVAKRYINLAIAILILGVLTLYTGAMCLPLSRMISQAAE